MNRKFIIKQCKHCMSTVKVIKESDCDIMCCGEAMRTLTPNSFDAAVEKHVPSYERKEDKIIVTVNHVMEEDHYIEWIGMSSSSQDYMVYLNPKEEAKAEFPYLPGSTLYAYCNKHSLWKKEVE